MYSQTFTYSRDCNHVLHWLLWVFARTYLYEQSKRLIKGLNMKNVCANEDE